MKRILVLMSLLALATASWGQCTATSTSDPRTWSGTYASGTTYPLCGVVYYAGNSSAYVSLQASNTGHQPDTSSTYWQLLYSSPVDLQSADSIVGSHIALDYNLAWLIAYRPSVAVVLLLTNSEYDNGTCVTAKTINPANGNRQQVTLTNAQTCALTFTTPASGTVSIQLKLIQSSAGSFDGLISTGGAVYWPGGSVPVITATSGAKDMVTFYYDGADWWGVPTQNFIKQ